MKEYDVVVVGAGNGGIAQDYPHCLPKLQEYMGLCGEAMTGMNLMNNPEELQKQCPNFAKVAKMTVQEVFDYIELPMELQSIFNQFWWYLGPSLSDFPFFRFAPTMVMFFNKPIYFPKHTCHGYLAEFEKIIRDNGGDIWFNTKVTEIMTEDNKVVGVKTNQGDVIKTKRVISNASPRITLEDLMPESETRNALLEKQKALHENYSFMIIYLGLNASAEELGIKSHHIFLNETNNHDKVYAASATWEGPASIGLLCPNVTIPDYSPEGTCVLSVAVPMQGFALEGMSQKEYFKAKEKFTKRVLEATSDLMGVNLVDYIEEISIATPATLTRYGNSRNGALGYALTFEDIMNNSMFTAELNNDAIEGLSFVGQFATGIGYTANVKGIQHAGELVKKMKGAQ